MAFIQPLLDRLFGKAEIQPESPEEQEQTLDFKAPEPPKPQPELQLPPDHPLYQLWNIYSAEKHGAPRPLFLLEGRETISDSEIKQELFRLQILINSTAKKRLELARPKQKKGEDPQKFQLDAQVVIFLPKNTLSAWLLVYPPVGGGKELDRADLTSALARERVSFGLDTTLLDDLPKNPKRYFRLFPIAWGEKPLHGTDGRIVELFPRSAERKFVVDENNRVDYTTLNLFQNVDEGSGDPRQGRPGGVCPQRAEYAPHGVGGCAGGLHLRPGGVQRAELSGKTGAGDSWECRFFYWKYQFCWRCAYSGGYLQRIYGPRHGQYLRRRRGGSLLCGGRGRPDSRQRRSGR